MFKRLMRRKNLSARNCVAATLCSAFIVTACSGFAYATPNVVTIQDAGKAPVTVKTASTDVGKVLSRQGIVLNDGDKLNISLNDNITQDTYIEIYRAMPVNVTVNGKTTEYQTTKKIVSDILKELGIEIGSEDSVSPRLTDAVESGGEIVITSAAPQNVTVQEEIAYNTQEVENTSLAAGTRQVVQEGKTGVKEITYSIKYEDGIEVSREIVNEIVLSQPQDEIIEYSPEEEFEVGKIPANPPTNYTRMEIFEATAYDSSVADNGPWAGVTSTGMQMGYGVIAVDPTVIPYGTRMYIESVDGKYKYGYAIAGDCGGAIKGKKVDLFYWSRTDCLNFGRRDVKIYFLD